MRNHNRFRLRFLVLCLMPSVLLGLTATVSSAGQIDFAVRTDASQVIVDRDQVRLQAILSDATHVLREPGEPALPYRVVNMLLPQGYSVADVAFDVTSWRAVRSGFEAAVAEPMVSDNGQAGQATGLAARSDDALQFPSVAGRYLGTGYLHGYGIASFAVFPVRIADGDLAVADEVRILVTTAASAGEDVVVRRRHRPSLDDAARRQVTSHVVNPEDIDGYHFNRAAAKKQDGGFQPASFPSLEGSPVDYVIITNDSLVAAWQGLADWKTAKGVPTVIRTTEWIEQNYPNGVDLQETIRRFVVDAYQNWGITYVLLGGDTDQIPARLGATFYLGNKDVPVDMYFGCVDGDWNADHDNLFGEPGAAADNPDLYQEVFVGRLPARNAADVLLLTDKVVSYETPRYPSYANKVLSLAEVLFPINWDGVSLPSIDGASIGEYLSAVAFLDPGLNVSKQYENYTAYPGSIQETAATAIDSINAGYNYVNHIGHGFRFNMSVGDASILNGDADLFTNTDRYSNVYLLNCTAVAYTYFCLAEHWLLSPVGGAVSAIGANESAFPITSQPYMVQYYNALFNDGVADIGEAFVISRQTQTPIAQLGDNVELWTHYIYSILADPEMDMWTRAVEPLAVTAPASMSIGTASILIGVSDSGGALSGAKVCLSKGTDDYKIGVTNTAGQVPLSFTAESAGSVSVVVTAPNRGRYQGWITVSPAGAAYVSYNGLAVDDDAAGGSSGNGDGVLDAGELVDLVVSAKNSGDVATGNVTLKLRSTSSLITVVDSVAVVGVMAPGSTMPALDPFRVQMGHQLGDETVMTFTLAVEEDGIEVRRDTFKKLVHAPQLTFVSLRIDDSVLGNGDGINQDNEEFRLFYTVKNFGTGASSALTATLIDISGGYVFTDSQDVYSALPSIGAGENLAGFQLREPNASIEHNIVLSLTDEHARVWTLAFELRPPVAPTVLSFDPSLGEDRLEVTWDASASPGALRYNVYRSLTSGSGFVRTTVDPVNHTVYVDANLSPTMRYFYYVTAVDASGNESGPSPEYTASTNPTQVEGWPIVMSSETVSSPVIGDIDGDQDFEVIQGNDRIYAWHHDGVELRDADGNAQTWGLFSTLGINFVSHIALSEVDAVPGYDIIAASRDTKEVFVFNYTGAVVAGWPRLLENTIRAGMVAGDINGDGQREIIALDEKGVLYVWDVNGVEYRDGDANPATDGVFARFPGCVLQYTTPAVADLDMDGFNEIVVGTQGDSVYVLNEDGTSMPGWPRGFSSDISGSIAIGDLDNDGGGDLEIAVAEWGGLVWALHHNGATLWSQWFPNQRPFGPSPALGDLDGDGDIEVVLPSANGRIYAIKSNGTYAPGWPVVYSTTSFTESSPIIVDIDNDHTPDVILGDETRFLNGWSGTGSVLDGFPLKLGDAVRSTPTVADLDKDGDTDLIAAGWDKALYVWDFPEMFNPLIVPWGGFHANLYNDGNASTELPIGITGATFAFVALTHGVELLWEVPAEAGYFFHIDRAVLERDLPGEFARIATDVTVGADGTIHHVDVGALPGTRYVYRIASVDDDSMWFMSGAVYVPAVHAGLEQNYPNPFNPSTNIVYTVPDGGIRPVSLTIYSVRGARVRALISTNQGGGRHTVEWNGRNDAGELVGSGIYFYRLTQPGFVTTRKMLLLK